MKKLKRIAYKIKLRTYKHDKWVYHATLLKLEHSDAISLTRDRITLSKLGLEIDYENFVFLLMGYKNATALTELAGAKFTIIDNKVMIRLDELTFEVQTAEELFILKEIFVEGVYNFQTTRPTDEYVLVDIGMNVAYASCYFSKVKKIPQIISFEPFTPTYMQAQKNITLNKLGNFIDAKNIGLGGKTEKIEVNYSPEYRGQVGLQGTDFIRSTITKSHKEEIEDYAKSYYGKMYGKNRLQMTEEIKKKVDSIWESLEIDGPADNSTDQ